MDSTSNTGTVGSSLNYVTSQGAAYRGIWKRDEVRVAQPTKQFEPHLWQEITHRQMMQLHWGVYGFARK